MSFLVIINTQPETMPHYKYRQYVGRNTFGMIVLANKYSMSVATSCILCHKRLMPNKTHFKASCPCNTTRRATYEWLLLLTRKNKLRVVTSCPGCDKFSEQAAEVVKGSMENPMVTFDNKSLLVTSLDMLQWPERIHSTKHCPDCLLANAVEQWQYVVQCQKILPLMVLKKWRRFVQKKQRERIQRMITCWRYKSRNKRLLRLDHENRRRIIEFSGRQNLVVSAPAGGGKTSLLLSCARESPEKKYLLLTFNKLLADEVSERAPDNLDVFTFDAICYNLTEKPGAESMTDKQVIQKAYPKCIPWYRKKGASGIANLVMEHMRGSKIHLCSVHQQAKFALDKGLSVPSFFTNRYRVLKSKIDVSLMREKLTDDTGRWDVVLVDEFQDLTTEALNILANVSCPVICVGDMNQNIYGFQNDSCKKCVIVPSQSRFLKKATSIQLYQTFRYGTHTIWHTFKYGSQHAASLKKNDVIMTITGFDMFRSLLVPGTAVLCRSNRECFQLLSEAEKTCETFPDKIILARIAGGTKVAKEILDNSRSRSTRSPLQGWIHEMKANGTLQDTVETLRLKGDDNSATDVVISTVHRAKGMQFKRVIAVNIDHINEPEVAYVAHTRHTHSLVLFDCESIRASSCS